MDTTNDCHSGEEAWHCIGLILHVIKIIVNSDDSGSFEPSLKLENSGLFERCHELIDLCNKDKEWIKTWDNPSKVKQILRKTEKELVNFKKIVNKRSS